MTVGVWNPFVVERLLLGHWPLLVGYAVLPWLVVALRDVDGSRLPARVPLLLVLGSLSASAGLATAVVALTVAGRSGARRTALLAAGLVGANAPWVVAGLTSPAASVSDPGGALVFATGDEGLMRGPLAALSFGGAWNAEVVPASRLGVAGLAMTVLLVAAAVAGAVRVARGERIPQLGALTACWCVGWGLATLSWAAPGVLGWLGEHVPGGGLVRDGSRLLGLAVPLVVALVAVAVDGVVARLPDRATAGLVGGVLALLPVTLMPDAVWGVGGRLDAVAYPASYEQAREAVAGASPGDAVSLPFESYRAPTWNDGRRVLDPLGRSLGRTTVVNDVLVVSGRRLAGEDPRSSAVAEALEAGYAGGARGRTAGGRRVRGGGGGDRGLPGLRAGGGDPARRRPGRRRPRTGPRTGRPRWPTGGRDPGVGRVVRPPALIRSGAGQATEAPGDSPVGFALGNGVCGCRGCYGDRHKPWEGTFASWVLSLRRS